MKLFLINPLTGRIDTKQLSLKKAKELNIVVYTTYEEAYLAQGNLELDLAKVTNNEWYESVLTALKAQAERSRVELYTKYCGDKEYYKEYS
jgi:hypothetical protein